MLPTRAMRAPRLTRATMRVTPTRAAPMGAMREVPPTREQRGCRGSGLANPGLWWSFDVSTTNALAKGFAGAAFDGTSLYLTPNANDAYGNQVHTGQSSVVARVRVPGTSSAGGLDAYRSLPSMA